jgi:hypothetical protein
VTSPTGTSVPVYGRLPCAGLSTGSSRKGAGNGNGIECETPYTGHSQRPSYRCDRQQSVRLGWTRQRCQVTDPVVARTIPRPTVLCPPEALSRVGLCDFLLWGSLRAGGCDEGRIADEPIGGESLTRSSRGRLAVWFMTPDVCQCIQPLAGLQHPPPVYGIEAFAFFTAPFRARAGLATRSGLHRNRALCALTCPLPARGRASSTRCACTWTRARPVGRTRGEGRARALS